MDVVKIEILKEYEMNEEDEFYKETHHHYYDVDSHASLYPSMVPIPSESKRGGDHNDDDDEISMKDGKDMSFIDRMGDYNSNQVVRESNL